jgi:hypothetical protein
MTAQPAEYFQLTLDRDEWQLLCALASAGAAAISIGLQTTTVGDALDTAKQVEAILAGLPEPARTSYALGQKLSQCAAVEGA